MNYRHVFHAGNFADVLKHMVLSLLLEALTRKDAPLCFIDTHAGAGRYDLASAAALKGGEADGGIRRLWAQRSALPAQFAAYLEAVAALNRGTDRPRYYPGSPLLAQRLLRPQDRLLLFEQVVEEAVALQRLIARDRRARVSVADGYAGLKAALPPRERRGLVLIDPPYERPDEPQQIVAALVDAHRRWSSGHYAIWYPIKDRFAVKRLQRALVASGIRKLLIAELSVRPPDNPLRLNGCGMVLANPPWRLDAALAELVPVLAQLLAPETGAGATRWLVGE